MPTSLRGHAVPGQSGAGTVLIIDDDSSTSLSLARLVRAAGFDVETYGSPSAFLQRPAFRGKGCAVIDIRLPEMTGVQLHDAMRARGMSLPVIFLTGNDQIAPGVHAMKNGAVDYLLKPVDAETMLGAIRTALERHGAERARDDRNEHVAQCIEKLTPRELEVMHYVIKGFMNKQIAAALDISIKTVKKHRAQVMEKMEAASVIALVRACETAGIRA